MKLRIVLVLFLALVVFVGQGFAKPPAAYSEQDVAGRPPTGNHSLDCTVIRPWDRSSGPGDSQYPVIVWANGWGGNEIAGQTTTDWYKPMLIDWALDGPYIVIAANQWSVREDDVLACLQWMLDQNEVPGGEYEGAINTARIGLSGHSQGGGAVVKAGDGEPNGFDITTVLTMNPYGPSWVDAAKQDGPMMILTGALDATTPESWTYPVFEAIQTNDQGGLYAVHADAGHSDLHLYQKVVLLWWRFMLKDEANAGRAVKRILDKDPWDTQYAIP